MSSCSLRTFKLSHRRGDTDIPVRYQYVDEERLDAGKWKLFANSRSDVERSIHVPRIGAHLAKRASVTDRDIELLKVEKGSAGDGEGTGLCRGRGAYNHVVRGESFSSPTDPRQRVYHALYIRYPKSKSFLSSQFYMISLKS